MPIKDMQWLYRGHMEEGDHLLLGGPVASPRKFKKVHLSVNNNGFKLFS